MKKTKKIMVLLLALIMMVATISPLQTEAAAGDTFKLTKSVSGYQTASDAINRVNAKVTYRAGTYYIYKHYGKALNITRVKGSPGAWIIPPVTTTTVKAPTTGTTSTGTYKIIRSTPGYMNAYAAVNGGTVSSYYPAGTYYIYKVYGKATNISRVKGVPGVWVKTGLNQSTASTTTPTVTPVATYKYYKATANVNVRTGKSTSYSKLGMNYPGTVIYGKLDGNWIKYNRSGRTAYTFARYYAETTKPASKPAPKPVINTSLSPLVSVNTGLSRSAKQWSWGYPDTNVSRYNALHKYNDRNIYLTFDNGYEYQNLTIPILDTLKAKGVKATFFVTGGYLRSRPDLVKRMIADGHIIGNHTDMHKLPSSVGSTAIVKDIRDWEVTYRNTIGSAPKYKFYRPGAGEYSNQTLDAANRMGYKTIFWGFGYNDWNTSAQPSNTTALTKLKSGTKPGNVMLLHAVSRTNANILGQYIDWARSQGYTFGELH